MGTKKEIWQKLDRKSGFTEPAGDYFEQFTSRMMEQLPEVEFPKQKTPTVWSYVKPWLYMAAMFAGIALMVRIFSPQELSDADILAEEQRNTEYYDELIWTSCVDDYSVYEYLADAYDY